MAGVMPKIVIPTGFEAEQRKAMQKRKLTDLLMELGATSKPMNHWAQAGAQMANALAGRIVSKKADKLDDSYNSQLREAYTTGLSRLRADAKTKTPEQMLEAHGGNPLLADALKPFEGAYETGMKDRQELVNIPGRGYAPKGDYIGKPTPNDPNDPVIFGRNGGWEINNARRDAALGAQGFVDPTTGLPPSGSYADPLAAPIGGPTGGGDGLDLSLLSPDERGIMERELRRRANPSPVPPAANVPSGSPLTPPPSGMSNDGKPYWIVNGVPYDNPEGR